ncbi:MAG: FHA domain-containing protein [Planctomycetota bacterium]
MGRTQGEVRISDPSVSQRHARFYKRQGFWRVLDLESTGGTKVEDRRVPAGIPLPLASGQVLTFGEARHLFLLPADLYGLVQASRRGKGGATARIVLPPEGMLLLDLFSVVKDVEDAPSESSPPFLLQIPLKGVSDDDFDEDESLTQSLSASMVLGLKRGSSQNVRVHSVHAQDGGYAVVGRAAGADVLLPEQSVSKRHARLQLGQNGAARVMDLESQNGTFHQDRRPRSGSTGRVPRRGLRLRALRRALPQPRQPGGTC